MLAHYQTWFNLPHALPLRLLQMFEEKEAATKLLKPEATAASVVHYKLKIHSKTLKYFMATLWLVLSRTQWLSVSVNPMTNWRPVQCVSFLHLQFSDLYQKSVRVRGVVLKKNQKKPKKKQELATWGRQVRPVLSIICLGPASLGYRNHIVFYLQGHVPAQRSLY